ncbi:hypothetical protein H2201_006078 [Coniosporium apollinis]|uniref:EGF domain-specific O-linked N-acetylglucosamine transferase n=2 Tax=Coniosporium TaxID=2810619 RepID=A0ABQ9NUI7_9PEZI|nr:hypothetical protein H2199_003734 [Cladosporium sp. JES 115]KAJ9662371.1 hypothetical protein H2201_006078 [Coniosporium apollinis]
MLLSSLPRRYQLAAGLVFLLLFLYTLTQLQLSSVQTLHFPFGGQAVHHEAPTSASTQDTVFHSPAAPKLSSSATTAFSVPESITDSTTTIATTSASLTTPSASGTASALPAGHHTAPVEPQWCFERFRLNYLYNLAGSATKYCTDNSKSNLSCFHSQTAKDGRIDSFCVGGPSSFDATLKKFKLDCQLRGWAAEGAPYHAPSFDKFAQYQYQTGPKYVFDSYVTWSEGLDVAKDVISVPRKLVILVKRENVVDDLFHTITQISSLTMTLDVLRMAPLLTSFVFMPDDILNTQIVVVDDYDEGPYWDLWTVYAGQPIKRLAALSADELAGGNVIVPLAGGSNPLWQADWEPIACSSSPLLSTLSTRVLIFYNISTMPLPDHRPLTLTFIDRKEERRLLNQTALLSSLEAKYPALNISVVDFANITFAQQLQIVHETDILVGVHGADLTHSLFLPPGSAVVEILPHSVTRQRFHNLAKMMGHRHFAAHADGQPREGGAGDWQEDDVSISPDPFLSLVDEVVKSMDNRGTQRRHVT